MTVNRSAFLAVVDDWKAGNVPDGAMAAVMRAFEATDDGIAYFSGPLAPPDPGPDVPPINGGALMGQMVTVDAAALAELRSRAALATPQLLAAAAAARANPVTLPATPRGPQPPAALSAPPAAGEPPEEAWDAFLAGLGLTGGRAAAPAAGHPAGAGSSSLAAPAGPSEEDLDRFVDSLPGLQSRRPAR
ncbi:MAG: hypothetical protein KGQ66_13100 [Acidobacteriota bacterium]|nr:hypothetical protein [Acidobacteriota bacterium]